MISPVFYFQEKLVTIKIKEIACYNGGILNRGTSKADCIRYGWDII